MCYTDVAEEGGGGVGGDTSLLSRTIVMNGGDDRDEGNCYCWSLLLHSENNAVKVTCKKVLIKASTSGPNCTYFQLISKSRNQSLQFIIIKITERC